LVRSKSLQHPNVYCHHCFDVGVDVDVDVVEREHEMHGSILPVPLETHRTMPEYCFNFVMMPGNLSQAIQILREPTQPLIRATSCPAWSRFFGRLYHIIWQPQHFRADRKNELDYMAVERIQLSCARGRAGTEHVAVEYTWCSCVRSSDTSIQPECQLLSWTRKARPHIKHLCAVTSRSLACGY
jgi:hypothetical protein